MFLVLNLPIGWGPFCVEFVFSPRACIDTLWVLWLPLKDQRHARESLSASLG